MFERDHTAWHTRKFLKNVENFVKKCPVLSKKNQKSPFKHFRKSPFKHFRFGRSKSPVKGLRKFKYFHLYCDCIELFTKIQKTSICEIVWATNLQKGGIMKLLFKLSKTCSFT
jgi:hypothetical protein